MLPCCHQWDVVMDPGVWIMRRGVIKPQWQDILVNRGIWKTLPTPIGEYHKIHMNPNGNDLSCSVEIWPILVFMCRT